MSQRQRREGDNEEPTDTLCAETPEQPQGVRGDTQLQRARNQREKSKTNHTMARRRGQYCTFFEFVLAKKVRTDPAPPMFVSTNWAGQDRTEDSPPLKADCSSWHFLFVANQGNMEANDRPVVELRSFSSIRFSDGGRRGQSCIFFESVLAKKVRTDPDDRRHRPITFST